MLDDHLEVVFEFCEVDALPEAPVGLENLVNRLVVQVVLVLGQELLEVLGLAGQLSGGKRLKRLTIGAFCAGGCPISGPARPGIR